MAKLVLIVDDDPAQRRILEETIRRLGYETKSAQGGEQAVQILEGPDKGAIALVEATPEGYKEKGRFAQPDRSNKNSWPHPVIAGGKLYLRDQEVLLCYDVKEK